MKVSVVVPVYNSIRTLEKCVDSLLHQSYNCYEIILVDNNSDDGSEDLIKRLSSHGWVRALHESRRSRGAARNSGIAASEGDVIVMTDSDCIVPRDWIEELSSPITSGEEEIVMGSVKNAERGFWSEKIQEVNEELLQNHIEGEYASHLDTKNCAFKKSVFEKYRFDPKIVCMEDMDFFIRADKTFKVRFLPEVIVKHDHKSDAISFFRQQNERGYWFEKVCRQYAELPPYPMYRSAGRLLPNSISKEWSLLPGRRMSDLFFGLYSALAWRCGKLRAFLQL